MNNETVERLIEIVRGHVFLYDLSHPQYKNACKKAEIWESLGRELNQRGDAVKSKWKTLRDCYNKYKKQVKSSTGSGRKNDSYTWAPQLAFLDDFNTPRASCSNVSADARPPSPRTQTPTPDSDPLPDVPSPLPSTSSSSQVPPSPQILHSESQASTSMSSRGSSRNKRASQNREDDDVGRVLEYLNQKKKKELDRIDNLFLSYADTFKKFPPREQAIVKFELAKLFSNTELKLLNNSNETNFNMSDFNYTTISSPAYSMISSASVTDRTVYSPPVQAINLSGGDNSNDTNMTVQNSRQFFEEPFNPTPENRQLTDYDIGYDIAHLN